MVNASKRGEELGSRLGLSAGNSLPGKLSNAHLKRSRRDCDSFFCPPEMTIKTAGMLFREPKMGGIGGRLL